MRNSTRMVLFAALIIACSGSAKAQITSPRIVSSEGSRTATLEEQLTNRLRATRDDQKAYIHFVVKQVDRKKLEQSLVVAVERYSIRRHREYPFPFFERAIRYEAAKRGVILPPIQNFATTKVVDPKSP